MDWQTALLERTLKRLAEANGCECVLAPDIVLLSGASEKVSALVNALSLPDPPDQESIRWGEVTTVALRRTVAPAS